MGARVGAINVWKLSGRLVRGGPAARDKHQAGLYFNMSVQKREKCALICKVQSRINGLLIGLWQGACHSLVTGIFLAARTSRYNSCTGLHIK